MNIFSKMMGGFEVDDIITKNEMITQHNINKCEMYLFLMSKAILFT